MKRKIVFAVYHDVNKEARSMEILRCCQLLGQVDFVSYALPKDIKDVNTHIIDKKSVFALFAFLNKAKQVIKNVDPDIVVLHDNDCAALIPFIKNNFPAAKIVYDSSELFIKTKDFVKTKKSFWGADGFKVWLKQKFTSFRPRCEKKYLHKADLIFAANQERAEIMKDYFCLRTVPFVFDNVHRIDDMYDETECKKKFSDVILKDKFNILFGGGLSEERKTFDYIESFLKLGDEYNLVIAGSSSPVAWKRYKEILKQADSSKLHYVGFITRAELRFCMKHCQASVVVFDKESYNTLFCESGKCYESLFEGTPILASENPPLKRLCDTFAIGVSDDDYQRGIKTLAHNYDQYVASVKEYTKNVDYEGRIERLASIIISEL